MKPHLDILCSDNGWVLKPETLSDACRDSMVRVPASTRFHLSAAHSDALA